MKIAWIRIKGFQQFEDTFLDFRHPDTGKALDKICLIGRNGTGKSTILRLINDLFLNGKAFSFYEVDRAPLLVLNVILEDNQSVIVVSNKARSRIYKSDIEYVDNWFEKLSNLFDVYGDIDYEDSFLNAVEQNYGLGLHHLNIDIGFKNNGHDVLIYCPSESLSNELINISDLPKSNLDSALRLFKDFPFYHTISNEDVSKYWDLLIFLIKQRDNNRAVFENSPLNLDKTKKQLLQEFETNNPDILKVIANLWNEILERAGLRFDYQNARIPIQLTENLQAYIVNKKGSIVGYNKLSTGVRNFIFRFGHIKTLYFNRNIKRGILLVDEPENSLFPDFLLNIIEQYQKVVTDKSGNRNTQMFFATHSPIIAAQFQPHERFILEWNDKNAVDVKTGISPIGDDPNDILYQDFGMTEIVSKAGQEVWKAYLDLKKQLTREKDEVRKKELSEEILEIGRKYNFA